MNDEHRIRAYWNWLPAFRAVAETEHLPTAAQRVNLTPAALSRSVRLLEEALGMPLFLRQGRRLHLNEQGRQLLASVRTAMRTVHQAHTALIDRALEGEVRVAAGGVSRVWVMRALARLQAELPGMRPHLVTPDPATVADALLRGDLDLVVGSFPVVHEGLDMQRLWTAKSAVYCGESSPLFGRTDVGIEELISHPFVSPPGNNDGWPMTLRRQVAFVADRMEAGVRMCAETPLLAVLPDAIALDSGLRLHRIPVESLPSTPVFAILPSAARSPLAERVLAAIQPG